MEGCGRLAALALAALSTAACGPDLGLEGAGIPLEVAATRAPKPLVQQTTPATPQAAADLRPGGIRIGEIVWVPGATEYEISEAAVRPVGTWASTAVYALAWDEPPHDLLLVRTSAGRYLALQPVW